MLNKDNIRPTRHNTKLQIGLDREENAICRGDKSLLDFQICFGLNNTVTMTCNDLMPIKTYVSPASSHVKPKPLVLYRQERKKISQKAVKLGL